MPKGDLLVHSLKRTILKTIGFSDILVDVGAGVRPCLLPCRKRILIEPHYEYVEVLKNHGYEVWQGTALERLPEAPREATVLCLDVIEHMTRLEGDALLKLLRGFKRAVIYTPDGFVEQETDEWGYKGEFWQKHRSGWEREDFPDWDVYRIHHPDGSRGLLCYR